ncbi:NUDIX hydrolase [Gracilimonas sp.]|uniref:NUDIX hydrolase n=1 Tax=Gracilimonas sp. TaxID=1974203 RepID=UPI002871F8C0|nr:NUDIX domain-containing protein [Gracilimonas sp.]
MSSSSATPITAGGGIVFRLERESREPEVLMIFRKGKWDLPKGKLEEGESIAMCAAREVAEEVESTIPAIVQKVGTTYHEYEEKGKTMGKTTHWYSMILTKEETLYPQQEEGITKVEWIPFSKAVEIAGFENLKEILRKFKT